jgi:hypothetical protein
MILLSPTMTNCMYTITICLYNLFYDYLFVHQVYAKHFMLVHIFSMTCVYLFVLVLYICVVGDKDDILHLCLFGVPIMPVVMVQLF